MRRVAFLRGINVGGHRVTKDQLIHVFVDLGFEQVDTYLASGNVLFGPGPVLADGDLGRALEGRLGYAVPTTTRGAAQLDALLEDAPFSTEALERAVGKPQVILLMEPLSEDRRAALDGWASSEDLLVGVDGAVHWLPLAGVSGSGISPDRLTAMLGVHTVRTRNTIDRIRQRL